MSKKDSKSKKSFMDRIKDSSKDFVNGVKQEFDEAGKSPPSKERTASYVGRKREEFQDAVNRRVSDTSSPEGVYYSTTAWFWAMFFVIIICLALFFSGFMYPRLFLVGLLALLAMPFLVIWCLTHMIPTLRIFGITVFDRNQLSLRRQLTVGKEIARFFTREFLEESPIFAFFLFMFLLIFILSILFAFVT
ncbi:hypothetical protein CEE45_10780 [Candidatus Heimdallarchaeota archaeon B3_Heim]|nr:MAG: hypothetical protein CEE45_10780 [Candidatus Heimdallarchaeota archaeon B3_Heim]